MQVRLVTRTHYQVDEPVYVKSVVLWCTSPTKSEFRDRVAARFSDLCRKQAERINPSAGGYAVDLAKRLGLLNDNLVWTEHGHLLRLFDTGRSVSMERELTLAERIVMFRMFLESDGAAMIYLARVAAEQAALPGKVGDGWNELANAMVTGVYREYLEVEVEPIERMKLKGSLERRRQNPFSGRSGAHQVFLHLQAMYRMGLIGRDDGATGRKYVVLRSAVPEPLGELIATCPGVGELEGISRTGEWPTVAARIFASQLPVAVEKDDSESGEVFDELREDYGRVMSTGVAICPLRPLIEAVQIRRLISGRVVPSYQCGLEMIAEVRRRHPRRIRFHVDYLGRPAFIVLANQS